MFTSVPRPAPFPLPATRSLASPAGRGPARRRIDGIELRLRRLVDSAEPAVVFTSLVRLCVPAFCDACSVDVVEGGRVRYGVTFPTRLVGPPALLPHAERSTVTAFQSELPGWASYTGVMTCAWDSRPSTADDEDRAAEIVEHAVRMIRSERLADPVRSGQSAAVSTGWRPAQAWSR